ncbi:hypothetical protein MYX82_12505 [Acidobacteria bacterium AH-259-D05]|nr:hypothetical protein [Acidobacteria bacterium AH-259-D05]
MATLTQLIQISVHRAAIATFLALISWGSLGLSSAEESAVYQWQAETLSRSGAPIGCSISVDGMIRATTYVTMNLSFLAEPARANQYQIMTLLKITATRINIDKGFKREPVKLYGGWVKAGSATTVGKLKTVATDPENHYLGALPGMDLFSEVFQGLLETGPTIGFQTASGGLDTTLIIPAPIPPRTLVTVEQCLSAVSQGMSDREGTRSESK